MNKMIKHWGNSAYIGAIALGNQYRKLCAALFVLAFSSAPALAANKIDGIIDGLGDTAATIINFFSIASVVIGIVLIIKGIGLVMDKSKDRGQDVKASAIFAHLGGGAALCVLWLLLQILVDMLGGSGSDVGADISLG